LHELHDFEAVQGVQWGVCKYLILNKACKACTKLSPAPLR
jgi:hypothetical protein